MKCGVCGGAVIFEKGYCQEPDRLACINCGREVGQKKKEETMELKERKCVQCGTEYQPKKSDSRFCSKPCCDKWFRENRKTKHRKPRSSPKNNPPSNPIKINPQPQTQNTISIEAELIRSIRRSVAKDIINIIQEAFA